MQEGKLENFFLLESINFNITSKIRKRKYMFDKKNKTSRKILHHKTLMVEKDILNENNLNENN